MNNATCLFHPFSICKWCAKSSINVLVQEKNSAKIKPLPIIYMHEYDYIYLYIYIIYTCFNQNIGKVYSPDSDSFYIQKNIHKSINITTPTILGIGTHPFLKKFRQQIELPHPIELSELDEVEQVSSLLRFPVFGGGNLSNLYSLSIYPIVKTVQDRFCSFCVKY